MTRLGTPAIKAVNLAFSSCPEAIKLYALLISYPKAYTMLKFALRLKFTEAVSKNSLATLN